MVEQQQSASFETEGIPSLYANVASITMSFHDMRIYLAEAMPTEVEITTEVKGDLKLRQARVTPRLCLIINPEFARNLRDAISISIGKYEELFGQLRPNPTLAEVPPHQAD